MVDDSVTIEDMKRRLAAAEDRALATKAALRESEARFRSLFQAMGQGYSLNEVVRDSNGRAVDIRYVEHNPALERLTGVPASDANGRLASEVFPGLDRFWVETVNRVVTSGTIEQVEHELTPIGRWYRATFYPVGGDRCVSLYDDITERKRAELVLRESEERQAFLLKLSDAIRPDMKADAVGVLATRMVAEHLGVDRCYIARFARDEEKGWVGPEFRSSGLPALTGEYRFADFPEIVKRMEAGPLVICDGFTDRSLAETDRQSYQALGLRAVLTAPLRRGEGNAVWSLTAAATQPRDWTDGELKLLEDVAERTWAAIERARAEAELRESDARRAELADAARVLIWETDESGAVFVNSHYLGYFGVGFEEIAGMGWTRFVHPDDLEEYAAAYQMAYAERRPFDHQCRLLRCDGQYRWHRNSGGPAREGRFNGSSTDIHDLVLAERALRESEEKYRSLFESMDEAFAICELVRDSNHRVVDYRYVEVNPAVVRHVGISPEALQGRLASEVFGNLDSWLLATYARVVDEGRSIVTDHHFAKVDRWLHINVFPRGDDRIAAVYSDVSERKGAERLLLDSEHRQAFLLRFTDAIRSEPNEQAIIARALGMLAEELAVDRAYATKHFPAQDLTHVVHEVRGPGLTPLPATLRFSDFPEAGRQTFEKTLSYEDTATDQSLTDRDKASLAAMGVGALLSRPLRRDGSPIFALGVVSTRPRRWTPSEVALVEEAAERIWEAAERARAATALHQSQERLRQFGEASQDILWIRDAATLEWTYLTPAFAEIYGLSREEALGGDSFRNWLELIVPEDRALARDITDRVLAGEQVTFEYRIRRPRDGAIRWLRDTDFPMRDDHGRITSFGGIGQDVTSLKAAEEGLRTSEERLRIATEIARFALWDWDIPTNEVAWSDEHFRMEGYAIGEVTPSYETWAARIHPDDRATTEAALMRARDTRTEYAHEFRSLHPDGSVHWLSARGRFFYDESGEPVRMIGAMLEITEQREWEQRQQVLVTELQHRTRNLMGVVRSMADKTARASADLPDFRARFRDRLEALSRVQGLLSRLNDVDRVSFDDLIRTELSAMEGSSERVTLEGPSGIRLRSSTVQTLAMALHELATNAIKYGALGQPSGHLTVTWSLEPQGDNGTPWLHIDWRESGVVIPPAGSSPRGTGQGRELIERALPYQLKAKTSYELRPGGVHCTISVPVSSTTPKDEEHA